MIDYREPLQTCEEILTEAESLAFPDFGCPDDDAALLVYNRAIRLYPTNAEAFYWRASCLKRLKREKEALLSFDQAVMLDPLSLTSHESRADCLAQMGHHGNAILACKQALETFPKETSILAILAGSLAAVGRRDEAFDTYNEVIRLEPWDGAAYLAMAVFFTEQRCYEMAISRCDSGLKHTDYPHYLFHLHWVRGSCLAALDKPHLAYGAYLDALTIDIRDSLSYEAEADKQGRVKCLGEAVLVANRVIELSPTIPSIYASKGRWLADLGRTEEAASCMELARELGEPQEGREINSSA